MGYSIDKLIQIESFELGYLEKRSNAYLFDKVANAGHNNYTKYWYDIDSWGLGDYQTGYWCAAFQTWCMVKAFGLSAARELLIKLPFISCQSLADLGKSHRQLYDTPKKGDIALFWDNKKKRFHHTEFVTAVNDTTFATIGGNTSMGSASIVPNGGGVASHVFSIKQNKLAGTKYFRPNYGEQTFTPKWVKKNNDWYWYTSEDTYARNIWVSDKGRWYFCDGAGRMLKNTWFKETKNDIDYWAYLAGDGGALQNQWYQDEKGDWYFLSEDCYAYRSAWLEYNGKKYYFDENCRMVKETT